jgi:hypothetical protein
MIYYIFEARFGDCQPHVHSHAIKARGAWIPGVIDPAAKGRSQVDGIQLIQRYRTEGLKLEPAVNAVEAGLFAVEQMMHAGKLKAFKSLSQFYSELRSYRRDENGKVVKERDHCMDAMRYLTMSGLGIMQRQTKHPEPHLVYDFGSHNEQKWMQ